MLKLVKIIQEKVYEKNEILLETRSADLAVKEVASDQWSVSRGFWLTTGH